MTATVVVGSGGEMGDVRDLQSHTAEGHSEIDVTFVQSKLPPTLPWTVKFLERNAENPTEKMQILIFELFETKKSY